MLTTGTKHTKNIIGLTQFKKCLISVWYTPDCTECYPCFLPTQLFEM